MARLTHIDESGAARMVNVGAKPRTNRRAVARGSIRMSPEAFSQLLAGSAQKGDVLAVARIAGIMAAKRTSELIPLCHNVPLASVQVDLDPDPDTLQVQISAEVENIDRTGVEMEALTAVSVACLTIYDMLKAVDREMVIGEIRVTEKSGGMHVIADVAPSVPNLAPPPSSVSGPPLTVSVVPKGATMPGLFPPPELVRSPEPTPAVEAVPKVEPGPRAEVPAPLSVTAPRSASTPPESSPVPSLRSPEQWKPRPAQSALALAQSARVRELGEADLAAIQAFLVRDRLGHAYLLGDLDAPYAEHCRWFGLPAEAPGELEGLMLLYNGLSMPALLTAGPAEAIEALMAGARPSLPRRFYCHIRAEHREAVETQYQPRAWADMLRMGLAREDWQPQGTTEDVEPLSHMDTAAIMHLYRHYPDNFFDPAQLGTGLYFGVRENGELLSVAGVHVVSPTHDVAVIGNIVTHTDHRGRGLASRCVSKLLESLFTQVGHVALNVQVANEPAISCYRKFGFRERCRCLEGWVQAR